MKTFKLFGIFVLALTTLPMLAQQPVNMSQVGGAATATGNGTSAGALRVTISSDSTGQVALAAGSATIGKVDLLDGSGNAISSSGGSLNVTCTSGCSATTTISLVPQTSGGLSSKHFVTAGSDNATNLKASAGQVYNVHAYNNAGYPVYVKLYNASSSPTGCGSTNLFKVFGVQAGTESPMYNTEEGWAMGTGISYCVTKGIADADDTAVLASDATVDIGYK